MGRMRGNCPPNQPLATPFGVLGGSTSATVVLATGLVSPRWGLERRVLGRCVRGGMICREGAEEDSDDEHGQKPHTRCHRRTR